VAAVGSYALVRRAGGRWLLRIEDLDGPRVVPGAAEDFFRTLEALGFEWDGEVVWQSRRTDAYQAALERLEAVGQVYPCGCTRAEIARAASAPAPGEEGPAYPGTCRGGLPPGKSVRAIRVRVATEPVTFQDRILGSIRTGLADSSGDFVVKRADGVFAYQLAVVVDDADAGVTQVTRGADLLPSTPRQLHLQQLLRLATPEYAHLPLVTGREGGKLSKRDAAVSLAAGRDLRREGGRLVAAALRFLGHSPPQDLDRGSGREALAWATAHFAASAVPRKAGPFPS
jgi:glutamyl-Q tRNA(Asp) synthetase